MGVRRFAALLAVVAAFAMGARPSLSQAVPEYSIAVLPTVAQTMFGLEVEDLGRQVARLMAREPGIRIIDAALSDRYTLDDSAVVAGTALNARYVPTTFVTGMLRTDVLLRDGQTGAIAWGRAFYSYIDKVGALPTEVWVAATRAIRDIAQSESAR